MGGTTVILGAGGMVAPSLMTLLTRRGTGGLCYSRRSPLPPHGNFTIRSLDAITELPQGAIIVAPMPIVDLPPLLPALSGGKRLIAFSSAQIYTNANARERLLAAEDLVQTFCAGHRIAWTIMRPAMIYRPPDDRNVSTLARFIRKFRFLPVCGRASGLRQPVHADDLAVAVADAIEAAAACNRAFDLPGGETLTFRAMAVRIFRALAVTPLIVPVPKRLLGWSFELYARRRPSVLADTKLTENVAERVIELMNSDFVLDAAPAAQAFGYRPRPFAPIFPPGF